MSITGNKESNNIIGTAQNDYIDGLAGADTIYGGSGNDTLIGGNGNDSLWGGAGKDTFIYDEGCDGEVTIGDYSSIDKIMIRDGVASFADIDGDDVIFSVGNNGGEVIVQGGASKYVELVNSSGNRIAYRNASGSRN